MVLYFSGPFTEVHFSNDFRRKTLNTTYNNLFKGCCDLIYDKKSVTEFEAPDMIF